MAKKVYKDREQAESAKQRAVTFLTNVVQDEDRADEVAGESLDSWLEETGRRIANNPTKGKDTMPKTKAQLAAELDEANDYIEQLEAKLDDIAGIAGDEEDEDDDDLDEDDDDPNA